MSQDIFEKGLRLKLRFNTPQGLLTIEDLWDLPLVCNRGKNANLNSLAQDLSKKLMDLEEDFVGRSKKNNVSDEISFEIVKYIISVKLEEEETRNTRNKLHKQREAIKALMAEKRDDELKSKSYEELERLLKETE